MRANTRSLLRQSLFSKHPGHVARVALCPRYPFRRYLSNRQNDVDDEDDVWITRSPYPFLWPSVPSVPRSCPYVLPPIRPYGSGIRGLRRRISNTLAEMAFRYPNACRGFNMIYLTRLLGPENFPGRFVAGALVGFEEFLRRLFVGADTDDLVTPEYAAFLKAYFVSENEDPARSGARILCPTTGGGIKVRDVWIFYGLSEHFALSHKKFGGVIQKSNASHKMNVMQLPFTSICLDEDEDLSLSRHADAGIQFAVDVEIMGDFNFWYGKELVSSERTTVVRFQSQAFGPKICNSEEEALRRMKHIQDNVWKIADVEYVWSMNNLHSEIPK